MTNALTLGKLKRRPLSNNKWGFPLYLIIWWDWDSNNFRAPSTINPAQLIREIEFTTSFRYSDTWPIKGVQGGEMVEKHKCIISIFLFLSCPSVHITLKIFCIPIPFHMFQFLLWRIAPLLHCVTSPPMCPLIFTCLANFHFTIY